jgi:Lon protease-like protein
MELDLDINEIINLDNFSGTAPIFPLSNVVLFPNVLLPLHIFEQRYRKMVRDALYGEKIITMSLLKPGWENKYYETPNIFKVACMARIVSTEYFDDGRSNIVLYGLKRVELLEIEKDCPYRVANIKIKEDMQDGNEEFYRKHLEDLLDKWNGIMGEEQKDYRIEVNSMLPLDKLTDTLATLIISNVFDRQSLLEESYAVKRAEKIIDYIQTRLDIVKYTSHIRDDIVESRSLN